MRWFEYKAEVDALHAPDELKARLRAMKTDAAPTAAPKKKRFFTKPARFSWKKAAGMAACFVGGAVTVFLAGSVLLFGGMGGASASDSAMAQTSGTMEPGAAKGESFAYFSDSNLAVTNGAVFDAILEMDGSVNAAMDSESDPGSANGAPAQQKEATTRTQTTARKIIYTANLTLESTEYDNTLAALQQALAEAGGYVESSENLNYGTDRRRVYYTLRVPAANYQSFLTAAGGAGSLTEKSEDSQDITAEYVDVAARIDTLEQQRDRLLQLSAQAESLTDLLEIEEKLTSVQYQLESYQRQMAAYDDRVNYCTVNVSVYEVTVYTPVQPTLGEQLSNAVTGGFADFADFMFELTLWALNRLPWLIVLAAAALVGRMVWRRQRR